MRARQRQPREIESPFADRHDRDAVHRHEPADDDFAARLRPGGMNVNALGHDADPPRC
jgi:hypothetical protein